MRWLRQKLHDTFQEKNRFQEIMLEFPYKNQFKSMFAYTFQKHLLQKYFRNHFDLGAYPSTQSHIRYQEFYSALAHRDPSQR